MYESRRRLKKVFLFGDISNIRWSCKRKLFFDYNVMQFTIENLCRSKNNVELSLGTRTDERVFKCHHVKS